ncbi:MAG: hypothetical protein HY690_06415 [Chloroflexi bacterium]|nr:hypothetical protein [Chloroflexota bacterium]
MVMDMVWRGVTPEQYDAARKLVDWEGDPPAGGIYHVASFSNQGLHVTDVWESAEAFQRFVDTRLMPGVQQIGIQGQPQVDIRPAHAVFAPGYQPATRRR